jgi:formylglycine-generating enzyme required for sulfatase activity
MDGLTPVYSVDGKVYRSGDHTPEINYTVNGYRLPTEAEWERAARGGLVGMRFPWGNTIGHEKAVFLANSSLYFYDTSGYQEDTFHPDWGDWVAVVGSYPANGNGLYDVAGNVYEFCNDYFEADYYSRSPAIDPRGPVSGNRRVFRGGSYLQRAISSRVSSRGGTNPEYVDFQFGFRFAYSVEN